mmetsp:Transcript_32815/g.78510  ORF Transcript_32815/g.78510 Transcript_32815/m.78510 type:complete len:88 (+) Transcript_32815:538-801(+)
MQELRSCWTSLARLFLTVTMPLLRLHFPRRRRVSQPGEELRDLRQDWAPEEEVLPEMKTMNAWCELLAELGWKDASVGLKELGSSAC